MITEGQAEYLINQIRGCAKERMTTEDTTQHFLMVSSIEQIIRESVACASDEPRTFHFKNIVAFAALLQDKPLIEWAPTSLAAKFDRFCLSQKPDEYKWGIFTGLYQQIYRYFYKWNVELDTGERLAKDTHFHDPRWVYENTEEVDPDFKEDSDAK